MRFAVVERGTGRVRQVVEGRGPELYLHWSRPADWPPVELVVVGDDDPVPAVWTAPIPALAAWVIVAKDGQAVEWGLGRTEAEAPEPPEGTRRVVLPLPTLRALLPARRRGDR